MEDLPEECTSLVLSCTSPREACEMSIISTMFRDAADSQLLWEKFLPLDYMDILSRLVSPLLFTSKKDLFLKLSKPLLIESGTKTFWIDKFSNKRCYMLSARELTITWSTYPLYWCWKPAPYLHSRFYEVAELVMTIWLEIHGKISSSMLSPNTKYGAYLVIKIAGRAYGLARIPSEVSVEFGNCKSYGHTYLRRKINCNREIKDSDFVVRELREFVSKDSAMEERFLQEREDGWLEIELGEFYNDGSGKEVKMSISEVKGEHLKAGLIIEGIEVRPKM